MDIYYIRTPLQQIHGIRNLKICDEHPDILKNGVVHPSTIWSFNFLVAAKLMAKNEKVEEEAHAKML